MNLYSSPLEVESTQTNFDKRPLVIIFVLGLMGCMLAVNSFLTVVAWFVLFLLIFIHWRINLPSVLLFALLYQWLAISIKVLYGNVYSLPLSSLSSTYQDVKYLEDAFFYSSIGLVMLALGLSFSNLKISKETVDESILKYDPKKVFFAYIFFSVALNFLIGFKLAIPGIAEAISNFYLVKWGMFVVLFYLTQKKRQYQKQIYFLVVAEFVMGFVSYFSSFKEIIFFSAIALFWVFRGLKIKYLPAGIIGAFFLFQLAVTWTAVKGEYREFLSGGQDVQKVTVSSEDALEQIFTLAFSVEDEVFDEAVYSMVDRVGYLDFFSIVIGNVPDNIPHQQGKVWGNAFTHIFKPRIFFPDKPIIDDSEHTREYAGVMVATHSMGASHSLGYMADAYIDFGPVYMFVPIFLFGLFAGFIYKNILLKSYNLFWGIILSTPLFSLLSLYERNSIKIVAQLIMYFLVVWMFRTFVIPRIDHLLKSEN